MRADARKNYDRIVSVARDLLATDGATASLRDIARTAGVGLGTMHRHFPTREVLLEALLRTSFDELGRSADRLVLAEDSRLALTEWMREVVGVAHRYSGAIKSMVGAIDDPASALHASCVAMKAAGTELLKNAQIKGAARTDVDGADLFALIGGLSWIKDQPAFQERSEHLLKIIARAILVER